MSKKYIETMIFKFMLLSCLSLRMNALATVESEEQLLHKEFIPTAFGIKSRTIDSKDADAVIRAIDNFILQYPSAEIKRIELKTCTSAYELPQSTLTHRKVDEHLKLAEERHSMIQQQLVKSKKFQMQGEAKVCGPAFGRLDLNDRFITKESGQIYEQKFAQLLSNQEFMLQLKEDALIEDPLILKSRYPSPFLAKFKPFQGVRLFIFGKLKTKEQNLEKSKAAPSGKSQ
jgi:hypothetical protein